jgi:hypothetical protein
VFATGSAIGYAYTTLAGDSTLAALVTGGWHLDAAPSGTTEPYGVIHQQSATDDRTMRADLIAVEVLLTVRVIGSASVYATLLSAAARVDTLLDVKNVTAPDGNRIAAIVRESELSIAELVSGVVKHAVGGVYRTIVTT